MHEKADTGIVRIAKTLWRQGSFWKGIVRLISTAFRPKDVRSSAEPNLMDREDSERSGLPRRYRRKIWRGEGGRDRGFGQQITPLRMVTFLGSFLIEQYEANQQ